MISVQVGKEKDRSTETEEGVNFDEKALAERLAKIHGHVRVSKEASGTHIYVPCPKCLDEKGSIELRHSHMHMAINVDKYFFQGRFAGQQGTYDADRTAYCMREGRKHFYTVSELLACAPITQRGYKETLTDVKYSLKERRLVDDGRGHMIPEPPGDVIPITDLPGEHPAKSYLINRNYDLQALVDMFDCSFCVRELPVDPVVKRFYKKYKGGFRDTPQGGIVFNALIDGVNRGWQRRIIEKVEGQIRYIYMPDMFGFLPWEFYDGVKWNTMPHFLDPADREYKFKPAKYWISPNCLRNEMLLGVDAAVRWNDARQRTGKRRVCILVEGPLDAGRYHAPGIAHVGKFISRAQAQLIAHRFGTVVYCPDNDDAGHEAQARNQRMLVDSGVSNLLIHKYPSGIKDSGDYQSTAEARAPITSLLNGDFE
jgi:hypothetical protein